MCKMHRLLASRTPPTGDLACNPGMCPDRESNQRHFGLQAGTQFTEPQQPGLSHFLEEAEARRVRSLAQGGQQR